MEDIENITLPNEAELNRIWCDIHPELPDVHFEWSTRYKSAGATLYYDSKLIKLSVKLFIQYGMDELVKTLRHEAAHLLSWIKHGDPYHGQWFWYYSGMLGAARYAPPLSANIREAKIRLEQPKRRPNIILDPETGRFKRIY